MGSRLELAVRNTDRVVSLVPGQSIIIGRTAQCDLQIDDPSVSRRHCQIDFTEGLLQVRDLDSANGTFLNERPVKESTARVGDLIRLGAAILEVRDPSGLTQRPDQTVFVDESTVESVIQRRIEPSSFDWLVGVGRQGAGAGAAQARAAASLDAAPRERGALDGP